MYKLLRKLKLFDPFVGIPFRTFE